MKYRRLFSSIASVALSSLCQCSLFDLSGLDDGGPDGGTLDATDDLGDLGAMADASGPESAPDGEGLDAAAGAEVDTDGGRDGGAEGRDDGLPPDAGNDPGVDAVGDAEEGSAGRDAPGDADTGAMDGTSAADGLDGTTDSGGDAAGLDAPVDGGDLTLGLVAFYRFDETNGTTAADATGHGFTATMHGANFAVGIQGNAATMNGTAEYVSLPIGIVSGLTSFSISAWAFLSNTSMNTRIFDFGSGTTTYLFFTPRSGATSRFGISTTGQGGEQQLTGPVLSTGVWQHVAITLAGTTSTLYINGVQGMQNPGTTRNPVSLGMTTQNWIGRSQYVADPYLTGQIDEFRIYNRALSPSEVQQLYQSKQ